MSARREEKRRGAEAAESAEQRRGFGPETPVLLCVLCVLCASAFFFAACSGQSPLDPFAASPAEPAKDAIAKPTENGPVKVNVRVWPAKPTLDDPIYLRLDVDAPAGISIDAPFQEAGDQRMGRFRVVVGGALHRAARARADREIQEQRARAEDGDPARDRDDQ